MKLSGARIERFLRTPEPGVAAALVYGPDEGLVRESVQRLVAALLDDPNDPFRASELAADVLRSEPGRLVDEAQELTLTGGRRVVRVRQASDVVTPACRALLQLDRIEALVILDAAELGPGSSLRKLFETEPAAVAIPCYHDQGDGLAAFIGRLLAEHGLEADPDALTHLTGHLGADRALTRSEIDRLALYLAGPDAPCAPAHLRVTLEDAAQVIGDSAALGLDDLVDAVSLGEVGPALRYLDRLLGEGQHPVRLVRALANHVERLHRLALEVADGGTIEQVVERARPPIHFRRKNRVKAALRRWPPARCAHALGRLVQAELDCKSTGSPVALVCAGAIMALCRLPDPRAA